MELLGSAYAAPMAGFAGGFMLGLAARRGRFCTLGAIEDAVYGQNWLRIRMWALAMAVAIAGTFLLDFAGAVDRGASLYARMTWNPASAVIGGLMFGYGMAIAGNCGYGALARFGGGDLRSFVIVLVMGISAYAVLAGPLAGLRLHLFPPVERSPGDPVGIADSIADSLSIGVLLPALAIAAALAAWALSGSEFRRSAQAVIWSVVVGSAIFTGWWATTQISHASFEIVSVESHTFTAPLGETVLFAMTSSGAGLTFSIGSVLGVVAGAAVGSISKGHFRWEACDDPGELGRQIFGGFMMGIGGVLAVGCSVGQGLSAFSMLAYSAPVVLVAIGLGAAVGLRQLVRGFAPN